MTNCRKIDFNKLTSSKNIVEIGSDLIGTNIQITKSLAGVMQFPVAGISRFCQLIDLVTSISMLFDISTIFG